MINLKEIAWKRRISLQGPILEHVRTLQRRQWLPYDQLLNLQQKKLARLLRHAYEHVPYFRSRLEEAGVVSPEGSVFLDKFTKLPLMERGTFYPFYETLKSDDLGRRKWYENWSGGSTGEPIRLIQDNAYFQWNQAVKIMYDQWSSRELVDKQIVLWASERDLMVGKETWKTYMGRWMRNEQWLNTRKMSESCLQNYVERINRFRPVQILAYVESLYELARYAEDRGLAVHSPRSIMTTASMLYPHMRGKIEQVFQAPVFNRYGSREIGAIACECEQHTGLHVSMFTHYVEIVAPDGRPVSPGETGELVITSLHNYAMPIIRYRIGDTASWAVESCSCGRSLPMLKEITGRVNDCFVKPNGELVDGRMFVILLGTQSFVKKFQVMQNEVGQLDISIIPIQEMHDPHYFYQDGIEKIVAKCRDLMGEEVHIQLHFVQDIPTTASGKFRFTISNVKR
ncbi:phenylacetate--CoA ligase family protein [Brevibacillus sp. NRS-1366]|uniref:phenylacetate--CoA ligase family protein n=1 Tax=Brevibacillus sp. NRS-1366 TaxID=3233899 RepID=UPI003D1ABFEB